MVSQTPWGLMPHTPFASRLKSILITTEGPLLLYYDQDSTTDQLTDFALYATPALWLASTMFANYRNVQNTDHSSRTYVDTICGVDIHITKLGPPDSKPCREARYRLWQADMSVYLDARTEGEPPEKRRNSDTVSIDEERKAMIWFSVSEKIRQ